MVKTKLFFVFSGSDASC